jgi:hypothetical protein
MGLDFDVLEFSGSGVEVPIERTLGRLGIFSNLIDKVQGSDLSQLKKQELIRDINDAKSLEIVYGTENAEIASGLKTSYVLYELLDQDVKQVAKLEMPSREIVHTTLDVFGLTPGFGEMFDLVNAGIYFSEGDIFNGTLSMGSSVPVLGNYVAGLKLAKSLEKAIEIGVKVDKDSQSILDPARQLPAVGKTTLMPSLTNPESLRGASIEEVERLIPSDWLSKPMRSGNGIVYEIPGTRGTDILQISRGNLKSPDPLHQGPYVKISTQGRTYRIPLKGNLILK